MQRIATLNKAVDLFGAGKHGFKDGNLAAGIAATEFEAAWCNAVQEELLAVIEAAGLAPSATLNQLLLALRSAGVFQTAPQFDNTTKVATTAWAKVRGMQGSGISVVTVTGALTAANAGGTVAVNAAGATTQTLPPAAALPAGGRVELMNINTGLATVSRAGADTLTVNNTTVTSLALGPGDTLTLVSNGVNGWYAAGGTAQLKYAAPFAGLIAGNGYQPLPGGLIVQWGTSGVTDAAGLATFTHPIAFPTANFCILPQWGNAGRSAYMTQSANKTLTTSQAYVSNTSGAAQSGVSVAFIVVGN